MPYPTGVGRVLNRPSHEHSPDALPSVRAAVRRRRDTRRVAESTLARYLGGNIPAARWLLRRVRLRSALISATPGLVLTAGAVVALLGHTAVPAAVGAAAAVLAARLRGPSRTDVNQAPVLTVERVYGGPEGVWRAVPWTLLKTSRPSAAVDAGPVAVAAQRLHGPQAEVAVALWPEWNGTFEDLVAAASALAGPPSEPQSA